MQIVSDFENGIHRLELEGSFDLIDVEVFMAHVDKAIDARCFRMVVDVGGLRFITSAALGSLLRAQARLSAHAGDLAVVGLTGLAASVFRTVGIDRKVCCFPAEREAIAFLRAGG